MKKRGLWLFIIIVIASTVFSGCTDNVAQEKHLSFQYFNQETNLEVGSPGFGLVRDRAPGEPTIASVAATGFGLSSIPIAIEEGWLTLEEGKKRAQGTLDTFLNMENTNGFYYHFVNIATGEREWNSEISNIDTAIFLMGALHVGEYFGGEIKAKAEELYKAADWNWFVDPSRNQFYMAYSPEDGFKGYWDFYAEQLMMYVLGLGSPTHPIDTSVYDGFIRHYGSYGGGNEFIHSWFGSVFTYQFSHAWIDFNFTDKNGVNWFQNSVDASLANYEYCRNQRDKFTTFRGGVWGVTASDSPDGYNGLLGAAPSGYDNTEHVVDGTVAPAGALGSIVFTSDKSINALNRYYKVSGLVGEYGLKDAFNLDQTWVADDFIGIDKGITLLMIENYQNKSIWKTLDKNEYISRGLEKISGKSQNS